MTMAPMASTAAETPPVRMATFAVRRARLARRPEAQLVRLVQLVQPPEAQRARLARARVARPRVALAQAAMARAAMARAQRAPRRAHVAASPEAEWPRERARLAA